MKHIPHVVVGAPWPEGNLPVSIVQWRHLSKVLRVGRGDKVTYTDGLGLFGEGVLSNQEIVRGDETKIVRPTDLTMVVAPPANKDRQRFVVEKLTELGVARLLWLETKHGKNRIASPSKIFSWVHTALEQSKGAWLMEVGPQLVSLNELEPPFVVCHPSGGDRPPRSTTVVIGPEGGFGEDEIPEQTETWDLGPTTLRIETAAIVAAGRIAGS